MLASMLPPSTTMISASGAPSRSASSVRGIEGASLSIGTMADSFTAASGNAVVRIFFDALQHRRGCRAGMWRAERHRLAAESAQAILQMQIQKVQIDRSVN